MGQIGQNVTIGTNWIKLQDLLALTQEGFVFAVDKTYQVSNNGNNTIMIADTITKPTALDNVGKPLIGGDFGYYEKDAGELYVKTLIDNTILCVEEV